MKIVTFVVHADYLIGMEIFLLLKNYCTLKGYASYIFIKTSYHLAISFMLEALDNYNSHSQKHSVF
jgi:hypothetical protein